MATAVLDLDFEKLPGKSMDWSDMTGPSFSYVWGAILSEKSGCQPEMGASKVWICATPL